MENRILNSNGTVKKLTVDNRPGETLDDGTKIAVNTYTVFDFSYYATGCTDIITITVFDNNDKIIETKKLKHYLDGKQPEYIL